MTHPKKWKILDSRMAFDHRWYKVRQDRVQLPKGDIIDDYFVSVRPDVAMVLPITADREVIFVYQYRHGSGKVLLELPAGTFDPQVEIAQVAALRELEEETGYTATALTPLSTLYDNPVKDTNRIHLFLAQNVQQVAPQNLDTTEEIDIVRIPLGDIQARIQRKDIQVAGTLSAIYLGLTYLGFKWVE